MGRGDYPLRTPSCHIPGLWKVLRRGGVGIAGVTGAEVPAIQAYRETTLRERERKYRRSGGESAGAAGPPPLRRHFRQTNQLRMSAPDYHSNWE